MLKRRVGGGLELVVEEREGEPGSLMLDEGGRGWGVCGWSEELGVDFEQSAGIYKGHAKDGARGGAGVASRAVGSCIVPGNGSRELSPM